MNDQPHAKEEPIPPQPSTGDTVVNRIIAAIRAYCLGYPSWFLFKHYGHDAYYRAWTPTTGDVMVRRNGLLFTEVDAITDDSVPVYNWRMEG